MIQGHANFQKQKQTQKQTPQMIYITQLLALPYQDIIPFLQEMTMSNPMLEQTDLCQQDFYDSTATDFSASNVSDSDFLRFTGTKPFEDSLHVSLRLQIAALPIAEREKKIALYLLGFTGNNGYLETPAGESFCPPDCSQEEFETLLSYLQASLEPKGVLARNLGECLALQIPVSERHADCFRCILKEDTDAFASHRITYLTKKYKLSKEDIQTLYDLVIRMNPAPGDQFHPADHSVYIRPDAAILWSEDHSALTVSVSGISRLVTMNREYEEMLKSKDLDDTTKSFLKQNHDQASLLLNSLHMCDQFYDRFLKKLLTEQSDFFRYGRQSLKPMTEKAFAESLGVSSSTVSRLVNSRYIRTNWGVFPLRYFFSSGISTDSGEFSSRTIKEELRKLIDSENPDHPYTDDELSKYLSDLGISISRRTISKYRDTMGIPSCKKRRRFTGS